MKKDAAVFWINTSESELHFLDAILSAYDGLANVRRSYRIHQGKTYFKVYVSPDMTDEFLVVIDRIRQVAHVEDCFEEGSNETISPK